MQVGGVPLVQVMGSLWEGGSDILQASFCVGNKGSIIRKDDLRPVTSEIKQAAIKTVSGIDSVPIIKICGLVEHHAEEDSDESQCQETTQHQSIYDQE